VSDDHAISAVRPVDDVLIQQLPAGEAVLLHMGREVYFGLDEVGTRIWEALTSGKNAEETVALLSEDYDVEQDRLAADLQEFYRSLIDAGLAEQVGS